VTTITWQTAEPARLAAWLRTVLAGMPRGDADGTTVWLANARIRIEGGTSRLDRLILGDADADADAAATTDVDAAPPTVETIPPGPGLVAIGIATVDTERYAADRGWRTRILASDPVLGAFAALVEAASSVPAVLLEPNTEGRLAATLARHGEGPVALYAGMPARRFDDARRGAAEIGPVSSVAEGPFGAEWAPLGRPAWGPHLLVVRVGVGDPVTATSDASGVGTIRG